VGGGSVAQRRCNLLLETEARSAIWEQSRALLILNYAALSLVVGITLWGAERIGVRLESLPAATRNALAVDTSDRFRELNSAAGPFLASAATAIAFGLTVLRGFIRDLVAEASAARQVRDDVSPDELALYCLHALTAAASMPSKAAVRRLAAVTLAGLRA
jgi:hypothetical protein